MVLPAIVSAARNALLVASGIIGSVDLVTSSNPSSSSSSGKRENSPPSNNKIIHTLVGTSFRWEIAFVLGSMSGYWLGLQWRRWKIRQRLRHFLKDSRFVSNSSPSALESPISLSEINGHSIDIKSLELQQNDKKSSGVIFRHIASPDTHPTSSLFCHSIEISPGSMWRIPCSGGLQIFYVVMGTGALCQCPCQQISSCEDGGDKNCLDQSEPLGGIEVDQSWKHALKKFIKNAYSKSSTLQDSSNSCRIIKIKENDEIDDDSCQLLPNKICQGDVFVVEPWSNKKHIVNDCQIKNVKYKNRPNEARHNFFNVKSQFTSLHIILVSDEQPDYNVSLARSHSTNTPSKIDPNNQSMSAETPKQKSDSTTNEELKSGEELESPSVSKTFSRISLLGTHGYNAVPFSFNAIKSLSFRMNEAGAV